jgi:peptidoglycan/xylan/chitin deacetylase (PgdA/CDA1 family)
MPQAITIVMYHYVRELQHSRYPEIKARTVSEFKGQLDYMARHYTFVTTEAVIASALHGEPLPNNAALLTFDDGYLDHYVSVFPLLHERGIHGLFFPPAKVVQQRKVLDVNKVHFVLASVDDKQRLVDWIQSAVRAHHQSHELESPDVYWERYGKASRFDPAEVIFIKRMLQKGLPTSLRRQITDDLFREFVSADEASFANELYLTTEQLRTMLDAGMAVGSHGYEHLWLDSLAESQQVDEIERSLEFMNTLGVPTQDWVMCYPYGGYNDSLLSVLERLDCAIGLTVESKVADMAQDHRFLLPRLDTNDIPID